MFVWSRYYGEFCGQTVTYYSKIQRVKRRRTMKICEGCGEELGVIEAIRWDVCMQCTKARHRTVLSKRCSCGTKRRPREVSNGCRTWMACDRCLGRIVA